MKETMIYEKLRDNIVKCGICAQKCEIHPGQKGLCKVRENIQGKLYSLVYGKAVDVSVDPIEKKPFFHFAPGSRALSVATAGCNLGCKFCQNWEISQEFKEVYGKEYSPKDLAIKAKNWYCDGIAYTYTEPAVFYEYVYDTAKEASPELYNVLVTNGYFTPEAIKKISGHIDAANVDYKGDYIFYRKYCLGTRGDDPVKEALKTFKEEKIWFEITNLIIPGLNDSEGWIRTMCKWIVDNLGEDVPIHFSRFYPSYKMLNRNPTPIATLEKAREIAKEEGLWYSYIGNVLGHKYENTYCRGCGKLLIKRYGFNIEEFNIDKNMRCIYCGEKIPIKGERWINQKLFKK
ncbi:MAG: AmmeMemoRadiSam system radical SAM enzyme [Thermotogae bacterium]|nr:AmmeMemoRadiSam system radical SAM enzyme [Candidatus Aenigmarchaeota archaeon]RKX37746.1 MAG: AmmeMemoRadiSam system radical SAM enzyme [Thermotogota bacterium]